MHFKLIVALVQGSETEKVLKAARGAGATGSTVISQARGEGLEQQKTFFGLTLDAPRDLLLLLVEEHLSRKILETIAEVAGFEDKPGCGIAFQIDVEDAVGIRHQVERLSETVEKEI
ncbi:P-II family nitrogen regulator [Thiorhodovibrio frisius]|uniref:Nitrogen regulatory protein PII n=1 Tax=Thiorhodovibrio frisius TaxID=631362 RepID=H8YXG5_9GAMM|nr:P-II family nitrogen regulator [Thiorhodovibrio frisius]EIC23141.1 nitrogen regulatory protein PII [Thiorhodovibrio frisius]WPL22595.1 hypothetical protein Thiofri_02762 [Thiorhodovibrio frisius]